MNGWAAAPPTRCPGPTWSDPCSLNPSVSSIPIISRRGRSVSPVGARPPPNLGHGAHARAGGGARGAGVRVRGRDPGPRGGRAPRTGWVGGAGVRNDYTETVAPRSGEKQGAESAALCELKVSRVEFVWLWDRGHGPPRECGTAVLSSELTCTSGCSRTTPGPAPIDAPRACHSGTATQHGARVGPLGQQQALAWAPGPGFWGPVGPLCLVDSEGSHGLSSFFLGVCVLWGN